ncbi:hypothetical protein RJ639_002458 [Escallonia herrerae]|uniref:Small auxin up regulated protein n=1 Tax=Escallonia herrerae TaxID=1293975 RepID=A0AA89BI50_9ASTE|nr:hypothetical protein RJ639_002458 [Escallonia herrerae]
MKKNLIAKTWERCRSLPRGPERPPSPCPLSKCKTWHSRNSYKDEKRKTRSQVAPEGCFSVYVGPEKQRFAIKTEYANHPMFQMLLEDAELEYGYNSEGPITLPCDVDLFYKVLAEMDQGCTGEEIRQGCGFAAYGSCSPFSPSRRLGKSEMAKGYGTYGLLTPSRLIKKN